jgi:hypothetical protein
MIFPKDYPKALTPRPAPRLGTAPEQTQTRPIAARLGGDLNRGGGR